MHSCKDVTSLGPNFYILTNFQEITTLLPTLLLSAGWLCDLGLWFWPNGKMIEILRMMLQCNIMTWHYVIFSKWHHMETGVCRQYNYMNNRVIILIILHFFLVANQALNTTSNTRRRNCTTPTSSRTTRKN